MRIAQASVLIAASSFATSALAWDPWPCEVMLCLANPQGPTAVSACVPPITKLWSMMKKPKFKMPTCEQVSYPDQNQMVVDIQKVLSSKSNPTAADISAGMTQTAVVTPLAAAVANVQIVMDPFDPCEGGRTQVVLYDAGGSTTAQCRGPQLGFTLDADGSVVPVYEGYAQQKYSGLAFDVNIGGGLWQRIRPEAMGTGSGVTYSPTQPTYAPPPAAPTALSFYSSGSLPPNAIVETSGKPSGGYY